MIAIDIPHPGATYFGANNYEAGLLAGRQLARWAKQHWGGHADELLLLELARAGSVPAARLRGVVAGVREVLHDAAEWPVVSIDGDGQFKTSLERVRKHLRETAATRILVGAVNDPSALGAARAFQEAGRAQLLRHRRAERRAARARGAARRQQSADRIGRLLSGAVRRRRDPPGARSARTPRGAAGGVRQAPARDARERRPPLSQRRADGRGGVREVLTQLARVNGEGKRHKGEFCVGHQSAGSPFCLLPSP